MKTERHKNLASMDPPAVVNFYDKRTNSTIFWKILANRIIGLGINKGKLLDIACGPGHLLATLAKLEPGLQLYGLDISPNMLEACRNKLRKQGLEKTVQLVEGSSYNLPFSADSFDLVVNTLGLHYMDDAPLFFQQLVRVLKPGGIGYIYAFRRDIPFANSSLLRLLLFLELWWRKKKSGGDEGFGHVLAASYTPQEVEGYLRGLPLGKFEIKKTRFTMTILLYKDKKGLGC